MSINKKSIKYADSDAARFLMQLSKAALADIVYDLALINHGDHVDFVANSVFLIREAARPILKLRGDRMPKES